MNRKSLAILTTHMFRRLMPSAGSHMALFEPPSCSWSRVKALHTSCRTAASAPPTVTQSLPDSSAPSCESAAPSQDSAAPACDSAAPSQDSAAPACDSAAPSQDSAEPSCDSAAPSQDSAAPSCDSAAPSQDSAAPSCDSAAPSQDSAAPACDSAAPSQDSAAPACDSAAPPPKSDCVSPSSESGTSESEESYTPDRLIVRMELLCRSHDRAVLRAYDKFLQLACHNLGIQSDPTEFLTPIYERITLLKSVHIHGKHRTQYEMQTYSSNLVIHKVTGSTADTYLEYVQRMLPEGISMEVTEVQLQKFPPAVMDILRKARDVNQAAKMAAEEKKAVQESVRQK